jgi:hypothetical protein
VKAFRGILSVFMEPKNYNPKAKEAFGKNLINLGSGLFKSVYLVIMVVPIYYIVQNSLKGNKVLSLFDVLEGMSQNIFVQLLVLMIASFLFGLWLRAEGLYLIHDIENVPDKYISQINKRFNRK